MHHIKHFFGSQSVGVTEGKLWSNTRKVSTRLLGGPPLGPDHNTRIQAIGRSLKPAYIRSLYEQILSCAGVCGMLTLFSPLVRTQFVRAFCFEEETAGLLRAQVGSRERCVVCS